MAYRTLELTLISAKDLANVNLFSKMEVYAVAMIAGDARSRKKTAVDKEGGKNPTWNAKFTFNVMEFDVDRTVLHVVIKSERAMGDREIGEVHIPIRELLDGWKTAAASSGGGDEKKAVPAQFVSYQVRRSSGRAKGVLNLSYKFGDPVTIASQPPNAYAGSSIPAYPQPTASAYPPQSGSAYPPHSGSAYPPSTGPAPAYPPPALKKNPGEPATSSKISEPVTAYPATNSKVSEPVTAYPPPPNPYQYPSHSQPGYGYPPPPQAGYGYPPPGGYPPQSGYGYGYPPQQSGYGYGAPPPVVQPQQGRKNKLGGGAGLGLGLLGGALGGMILGDMVSDASGYDAGYDNGFDDGFDF